MSDIHILLLPPDAHKTINALQIISDIVLQKSLKEGFGLTVTEAMWKGKPVIGGNTGGIRLQVINHHTGFLVDTPDSAAQRIQQLLRDPEKLKEMGRKAKEYVRNNFLITRPKYGPGLPEGRYACFLCIGKIYLHHLLLPSSYLSQARS